MIIANKATMIWGWDYSSSDYNWTAYPNRMEAGQGYWVRTRIANNTYGHLNDVMASDYNTTLVGDMNSSDINTSRFDQIIALFPIKDEWVLLGNSTDKNVTISDNANTSNDGNRSNGIYYFEDLLNTEDNCYFVSIYHWKTTDANTSGVWVNDTESGKTTEPIPAGAGMWVKQRLCDQ